MHRELCYFTVWTCQTTLCGLSGLYGIVRRDLYVSNVSALLQMALESIGSGWGRLGTQWGRWGTFGDDLTRHGSGHFYSTGLFSHHKNDLLSRPWRSSASNQFRINKFFGSDHKNFDEKNVFSRSIMGKEMSVWSQLMASQLTKSFPVCHLSSSNTRMWISSVNDCFLADFEALTFARFWGTFGDTRGRTQM